MPPHAPECFKLLRIVADCLSMPPRLAIRPQAASFGYTATSLRNGRRRPPKAISGHKFTELPPPAPFPFLLIINKRPSILPEFVPIRPVNSPRMHACIRFSWKNRGARKTQCKKTSFGMLQIASECFELLQNASECFRMLQNASDCF